MEALRRSGGFVGRFLRHSRKERSRPSSCSPAHPGISSMTSSQIRRFAVMLLVTLTVACGGSDDEEDNPISPSAGDPGITNNTDDFQFNLPNVTNYSTNGGYP